MKTLFVFLSPLLASLGLAFTLNSTSSNYRGWDSPNIQFQLNLSSCPASVDVRGIIKEALDVWNNVPTSKLKLSVVEDTSSTTYSNPITVVCDTSYGSSDPGMADGSPGAAGIRPQTGDVTTSGIMYLNASSGRANIANFNRDVVAIVLAHEIGHLVGLGHSQDINALMYYDASLKGQMRLAQDDMDGISYLYPRDEMGKDKMLGCASIGRRSGPPSGPQVAWCLLMLLMPIAVYAGLRTGKIAQS